MQTQGETDHVNRPILVKEAEKTTHHFPLVHCKSIYTSIKNIENFKKGKCVQHGLPSLLFFLRGGVAGEEGKEISRFSSIQKQK